MTQLNTLENPHIEVTAGFILRGKKILITQRMKDDKFSDLWEFPGGKKEEQETLEQCLIREIVEELNFHISPDRYLFSVAHSYDHIKITLHVFLCSIKSGEPGCREVQNFKWVTFDELKHYHFTTADEKVISRLTELKDSGKIEL